jgi:hypothetical protein
MIAGINLATRPNKRGRSRRPQRAQSAEKMFFVVEGAVAVSTAYLLALLLAARGSQHDLANIQVARSEPSTSATSEADGRLRLVVLVPAHDEERGIRATLTSLASSCYPSDRYHAVVIADNCSDATAVRARDVGVEVWERFAPVERGKGFALAWALEHLQASVHAFDAVIVLDADCIVSPNMLSAIDTALRSGARAVQVSYQVGNPRDSAVSALRFAAFALMDTVRPLGKRRLGLSCGLFGTGMAFTRELLSREPWTATGLAEDGEYHLRLVEAGERVEFIPGAWVRSAMPTSLGRSIEQQARWEKGKLELIRRWSPRLVGSGLARRDIVRVHAGLEHLVPPQSLLAAGSLSSGLAGLLLGSRRLFRLSVATLAAQLTFVLGGLRIVGAPAEVYRALAIAPALISSKIALYARLLIRRGPTSWVRTERESVVAEIDTQ